MINKLYIFNFLIPWIIKNIIFSKSEVNLLLDFLITFLKKLNNLFIYKGCRLIKPKLILFFFYEI